MKRIHKHFTAKLKLLKIRFFTLELKRLMKTVCCFQTCSFKIFTYLKKKPIKFEILVLGEIFDFSHLLKNMWSKRLQFLKAYYIGFDIYVLMVKIVFLKMILSIESPTNYFSPFVIMGFPYLWWKIKWNLNPKLWTNFVF